MRAIPDALLELIYPSRANCMGCGSPLGADEGWLCAECHALLIPVRDLAGERYVRCGRPGQWNRCAACRDWLPGVITLARFVYPYGRPVERMIRLMKYSSVRALADWMGAEIARMMAAEALPESDIAVPVPMHPRRLRVRGFNHAELLCGAVARRLSLPARPALTRVRNTRQQARLGGAERKRNLVGAFRADAGMVAGARVLLVDDVLTSGATALHCAHALKAAGASEVYVVALAGAMK